MAESYNYKRSFPAGTERITTGCQYCAVGCGYNAFLVPDERNGAIEFQGVSRFITPAMRSRVKFRGKELEVAVAPDVRCDLNKGNHSVRGGSQGGNLVTADGSGRSTEHRLTSPLVRLADAQNPAGKLVKIDWKTLDEVMARLVEMAAGMEVSGSGDQAKIRVVTPQHIGVKIYEYQYLENTYAATKLFYSAIGTPNVAYHDRPSTADSSPGMRDAGLRPHAFSYDEVRESGVVLFIGTNPYENQSVFFMQYCTGKQMIVIDPRRTATAQYAEKTGGLHLQPTKLGADSLLLYAITRELILRWKQKHGLANFPWRDTIASEDEIKNLQSPGQNESVSQKYSRMRRASRAADFDTFARKFLKIDDDGSLYTLNRAVEASGIDRATLEDAIGLRLEYV